MYTFLRALKLQITASLEMAQLLPNHLKRPASLQATLLKRCATLTLIKTSILSGIATLLSVVARFIINKVVSVHIGPAGLTLIGQLQNFVAFVLNIANGSINTGVTKYLAETSSQQEKHDQQVIISALWVNVICALGSGLVVFLGAKYWALELLSNIAYTPVFQVFAVTLLFFALNTLFMAILNGKKQIKIYISINILGSLIGLCMTVGLIYAMGLTGGLYAIVINQSIIFLVTCFFICRTNIFNILYNVKHFLPRQENLKKLASYALMTFTAAAISPFVNILMRTNLIEQFGEHQTGYWQGVWYISMMYLMLITTSLKTYLLPKLSEIQEKVELRKEIRHSLSIIVPLVLAGSTLIYLLRDTVILIAFSKDFHDMRDLFLWQMIGDVLKVTGWVFGMVLAAKAMIIRSMIANTLFGFVLYGLSVLMTHQYGLIGITYAYALNYALFLPFIFFLAKPAFTDASGNSASKE